MSATLVPALDARLARVEGQVRGVHNMVGDERPLLEILAQVRAAQRALDEVALVLVERELDALSLDDDEHAKVVDWVRRVAARR